MLGTGYPVALVIVTKLVTVTAVVMTVVVMEGIMDVPRDIAPE